MKLQQSNRLILVDGSGYIFRAYYALPPMYRDDGTPVNAVFGFTKMLLKVKGNSKSKAKDHLKKLNLNGERSVM